MLSARRPLSLPLLTRQPTDFSHGVGRRLSLHCVHEDVATRVFASLAQGLSVGEGFPDEIVEVENVFLGSTSDAAALYDESGRRIEASAVRRGSLKPEIVFAPETITPPADYVTYEQPVLYLGRFFRHWGHALTEGVSRLWARHRYPELARLPAVYAGWFKFLPSANGVDGLFESLRGFENLAFLPPSIPDRPVKLRKAFVPAPSFVNRASAFPGHLAALREVAQRLVEGRVVDPRPVYLSRTRLTEHIRSFEGEAELESALVERGFRIVWPEAMTFRQQVELVNAHDVFVGVGGSALHNLMFALRGEDKVAHNLVAEWGAPNANQVLMDAIIGNESHYAGVCRLLGRDPERYQIDVAATLEYLRGQGLMGAG